MKIWGMDRVRKNRNKTTANRRLRIEQLEDKRLLAIVWANPDLATNGFNNIFAANSVVAADIVNRAIND